MTFDFPSTPQACLIYGGPRTGKTRRLIERAAKLIEEGACPSDIVMFAATPDAADELHDRMALDVSALADIRVTTPRALSLSVLATPEARAYTGRNPRVLNQYETSFLLEDMKSTGIRPKRLKGMMGFFYRCWTELSDLDPEWLELKEEEDAYGLLTELLDNAKAYLEPQLSNVAWRVLNAHPDLLAQYAAPHVIVDDYPCLSMASQLLTNLIARHSICIAGDPAQCVEASETYPHAAGMDEFAAAMPYAERIELTDSYMGRSRLDIALALYQRGACALEHDNATSIAPQRAVSDSDGLILKACLNPEEETTWVTQWVKDRMDEGVDTADLAIIVPSAPWERRMANALRQADIPVNPQSATRPIGGDIRADEACRPARIMCLLALASNPFDEPSLRAWCGFGEYLTNAQIFAEIRAFMAQEGNISLYDTLAAIAARKGLAKPPASANPNLPTFQFKSEEESVASAFESLSHYLDELAGLTGRRLVNRAFQLIYGTGRAAIPLNLAHLLGLCAGEMNACDFNAAVTRAYLFPRMPRDNGVRIMRQEAACGVSAKAVAIVGLVNGFTPSHQSFDTVAIAPDRAEVMRSKASRGLLSALGMASENTALSWFVELPYREATQLDLKVERIFIKDGLRRARVARTVLLEDTPGQ